MNLTVESLDNLSRQIRNLETWKMGRAFELSLSIHKEDNSKSGINTSANGSYIKPSEIIKPEERIELFEYLRTFLNDCLERREREAKQQFKKELLGED